LKLFSIKKQTWKSGSAESKLPTLAARPFTLKTTASFEVPNYKALSKKKKKFKTKTTSSPLLQEQWQISLVFPLKCFQCTEIKLLYCSDFLLHSDITLHYLTLIQHCGL